jgi:hypothetical protein
MTKRLVALVTVVSFLAVGCYKTHLIADSELETLQASESGAETVTATDGCKLQITDDTKMFVRSKGGKRYPITPFNFKTTESQLVAADRDYIFDKANLRPEGEVDTVNVAKVAGAATIGALALAGLIVLTIFTAGSKSQSGGQ